MSLHVLCEASGGGGGQKWKEVHATMRASLPSPTPCWSRSHCMKGVGPAPRVLDVIDVIYSRYHHVAAESLKDNEDGKESKVDMEAGRCKPCSLIVDVSQDARRGAYADAAVRSMCSGSVFYSYQHDRLLCPSEHLLLLGWNRGVVESLPDSLTPPMLRELSGESMACPSVGVALSALLATMGAGVWKACEQPT